MDLAHVFFRHSTSIITTPHPPQSSITRHAPKTGRCCAVQHDSAIPTEALAPSMHMHGSTASLLASFSFATMSTTQTLLSTGSEKRLSNTASIRNNALATFHDLCDHCERFFCSWDVIDAVQTSSALPDHACKPVILCTVEHLLRTCRHCHLCVLLLRALELFPNKDVKGRSDAHVYLCAVGGDDCVLLQVSLGSKSPSRNDERKLGATLSLRHFSRKKI
jgi:hypothetical protein